MAPPHSLLVQSQDATEAKLAVNGDGFGIAWYRNDGSGPGQYRDVLPAWSDGNLSSHCQMITSPLFLVHVRASTTGETARVNCHPFRYGRWAFMHNGQLGGYRRTKRRLEAMLPDDLYHARAGTTDSELLFLLLLPHGLQNDPRKAVAQVLGLLSEIRDPADTPHRITSVFSDGRHLFVFRYASDKKCPTLYERRAGTGRLVASEPLDGDVAAWSAVPPNQLLCVTQGEAQLLPFLDFEATA